MDRPGVPPGGEPGSGEAAHLLGPVVRQGVSAALRIAEAGLADRDTPPEEVLAEVSRLGRRALDDVRRLLRELSLDPAPPAGDPRPQSRPRMALVPLVPLVVLVGATVAAAVAVPVLRGPSAALAGLVVVATAAARCRPAAARGTAALGFALATASALAWSGIPRTGPSPVDGHVLAALLAPLAVPVAWAVGTAVRGRRERSRAAQRQRRLVAEQREEHARRAGAERRHLVAREVHDVVAHSLVVLIAQADGGRLAAASDPQAAVTALRVVAQTAQGVLGQIEPLVGAAPGTAATGDAAPAGPVTVDVGVEDLVRTARSSGLSVESETTGTPVALAPGPASAVHRVVQEALTNALKHAGPAAHVRVRLAWDVRHVAVEVRDDGRGAGALIGSDGRGLGLAGMQARVEAHGGTVDARPMVGGGFRVLARVPVGALPDALGALSATGIASRLRSGRQSAPDTEVVSRGTAVAPEGDEDATAGGRVPTRSGHSVPVMTSASQYLAQVSGPAGTPAYPPRAALRAEGLVKTYGEGPTAVHALAGVDLAVPAGTFTAIMGPSGSGKSTLLHCLAALDTPTSGHVWIGDVALDDLDDDALTRLRRDRVGFVFQGFNLLPALTARQNILLPGELARRRPDPAWLDQLTNVLGLSGRLHHLPGELSGGQQQRVAIARALLFRPTVVMADEPTGNLDSAAGAEVLSTLRTSVRELGQTVVMVTHDAGAAAYTDRVLLLSDGRLRARIDAPTLESVSAAMTALAAQAR